MLTSLIGALIAVMCAAVLLFCSFAVYGFASRMRDTVSADFVVVLGTTLTPEGDVPPLLAARLDRATLLINKLTSAGGAPVVIVSGGQTPKDPRTEADAMAEYLTAHGARSDRLVHEGKSYTTEENIGFSGRIMQEMRPSGFRCAIVTSDYHCPRVAIFARRAKLPTVVMGANTPVSRWFSGAARDFAALVFACWKPVASACAVIALAAVLIA